MLLNMRACVDLRPTNLPSLLQIQPELCSSVEVAAKAECRVGRDATLSIEDCGDSIRGYVDRFGQCVRRKAKVVELLALDFAWMHRVHSALGGHVETVLFQW